MAIPNLINQMLHDGCRISIVYGGSSQTLAISGMPGKRLYNRIVAFVGQVMLPQSRTGRAVLHRPAIPAGNPFVPLAK